MIQEERLFLRFLFRFAEEQRTGHTLDVSSTAVTANMEEAAPWSNTAKVIEVVTDFFP